MTSKAKLIQVIYMIFILILSFGLLTGFEFAGLADFQFYDTYYVFSNIQILIFITLCLLTIYLIIVVFSELASRNKGLTGFAVFLSSLFGLAFFLCFLFIVFTHVSSSGADPETRDFGLLVLVLGISGIFFSKSYEIRAMSLL